MVRLLTGPEQIIYGKIKSAEVLMLTLYLERVTCIIDSEHHANNVCIQYCDFNFIGALVLASSPGSSQLYSLTVEKIREPGDTSLPPPPPPPPPPHSHIHTTPLALNKGSFGPYMKEYQLGLRTDPTIIHSQCVNSQLPSH